MPKIMTCLRLSFKNSNVAIFSTANQKQLMYPETKAMDSFFVVILGKRLYAEGFEVSF